MKNKIFILGAIMGSFVLGSCGDFLEEESQSEVIPRRHLTSRNYCWVRGIPMSRLRTFLSYP